MHQGQDRIPYDFGFALEFDHIKFGGIGFLRDDSSSLRRNDPKLALHFGQGNLSFGVAKNGRSVIKHVAHCSRTKHIFKN